MDSTDVKDVGIESEEKGVVSDKDNEHFSQGPKLKPGEEKPDGMNPDSPLSDPDAKPD